MQIALKEEEIEYFRRFSQDKRIHNTTIKGKEDLLGVFDKK
jgi:hypothetical protein